MFIYIIYKEVIKIICINNFLLTDERLENLCTLVFVINYSVLVNVFQSDHEIIKFKNIYSNNSNMPLQVSVSKTTLVYLGVDNSLPRLGHVCIKKYECRKG